MRKSEANIVSGVPSLAKRVWGYSNVFIVSRRKVGKRA